MVRTPAGAWKTCALLPGLVTGVQRRALLEVLRLRGHPRTRTQPHRLPSPQRYDRPAVTPATPAGGVDPQRIRPGYAVYAHHVDAHGRCDVGQYVGVVHAVIAQQGVPILHVRGGLQHANEWFLPMGAVQAIGGKQVHLSLSAEALAGQVWHQPELPRVD